jgi:hypothetical protein
LVRLWCAAALPREQFAALQAAEKKVKDENLLLKVRLPL